MPRPKSSKPKLLTPYNEYAAREIARLEKIKRAREHQKPAKLVPSGTFNKTKEQEVPAVRRVGQSLLPKSQPGIYRSSPLVPSRDTGGNASRPLSDEEISKLRIDQSLSSEVKFVPDFGADSTAMLSNPPQGTTLPKQITATTRQFLRSVDVKEWILHEAKGECEGCGTSAPFRREDGTPYLEIHHLKPLAAGGADVVENTVALCPNCHREMHYGENAKGKLAMLYETLPRLAR